MKALWNVFLLVIVIIGVVSGISIFLGVMGSASIIFDGAPDTGTLVRLTQNPTYFAIMLGLAIIAWPAYKIMDTREIRFTK